MTFNPYRTTASSGFTHIAAYIVKHLLDDVGDLQPIDELGQQRRPDRASRGLNQPRELAEFMSSDNRPLTNCRTKRINDDDPAGCG